VDIDILYIDKRISESSSLSNKEFYFLDTLDIIEEYKKLLNTTIKIDFFEETNNTDTKDILLKKKEIVKQYLKKLEILGYLKYLEEIKVKDIDDNEEIEWQCPNKNCTSQNFTESKEIEGLRICIDCGSQNEISCKLTKINNNDTKRINICPKYAYDKKSHFLTCCNQFQGKSKIEKKELKELIKKIKDEIIKYNIIDRNDENIYRSVSKEHISIFLKELNVTRYYGDINLIHHKITNVPLHDISHLMDKLLIDFDQFVKQHNKHYPSDSDHRNFNYQLLLYQLLRRHKYDCSPTEFNFLKTTERKVYHDGKCRLIFMELGWNYTCLF